MHSVNNALRHRKSLYAERGVIPYCVRRRKGGGKLICLHRALKRLRHTNLPDMAEDILETIFSDYKWKDSGLKNI